MLFFAEAWMPSYLSLRNAWPGDLYVMDVAMTWTFVMTHEHHLGPYFVEAATDDMT